MTNPHAAYEAAVAAREATLKQRNEVATRMATSGNEQVEAYWPAFAAADEAYQAARRKVADVLVQMVIEADQGD